MTGLLPLAPALPGSDLLTTSRIACYRRCEQLHHLRYDLGYRPHATSIPLRFGTLVHVGLEAWWRARGESWDGPLILEGMLYAIEEASRDERYTVDAYELQRATSLLLGYHGRWIGVPVEVLAVEVAYETALVNPATGKPSKTFRLAGKIDVIARLPEYGGRVYTIEHKTSSESIVSGSPYFRKLRLDSQISHYHRGGQALGYDIAGCIYDVLASPGQSPKLATPVESRKYTKPTKAEPEPRLYAGQRDTDETAEEYGDRILEAIASAPEAYYQRVEVVRLEADLDAHDLDTWQTATAMREARRLDRHPRSTGACFTFGRECEFFNHCGGAESLDSGRFRQLTHAHPELQQTEENSDQ